MLTVDKYHVFPQMPKWGEAEYAEDHAHIGLLLCLPGDVNASSISQNVWGSQILGSLRKKVQVEVLIAGGAKFKEAACRHFTLLQPVDFIPFWTVSAACVAQTIHSTVDNVFSVC